MPLTFNEYIFIPFFLIVISVYWGLNRNTKYQNLWILCASYIFYGFGNYLLLFIIIGITISNYFSGLLIFKYIEQKKGKIILYVIVIFDLCFLGVFKYFNFFTDTLIKFISIFGFQFTFTSINLIFPIGISFFIFQVISYNVDIFHEKMQATKNFITFGVFVAFFPKLIAGPIERAKNFIPQITNRKIIDQNIISSGFQLTLLGLFKKVVVSDIIARYIADFYTDVGSYSSSDAFVITLLFTLQIYADFSGYSNMARGISKFFGINLVVNFNYPYLSRNVREFWRKWHISLSSWLTDYLYIPLGGSREKKKRKIYFNGFVTMTLGGLWHGAGLNFILWGVIHGFYLMITRIRQSYSAKKNEGSISNNMHSKGKNFISWLITFNLVNIAWIFFRAPSAGVALSIIVKIITFQGGIMYSKNYLILLAIFSTILFGFDLLQRKQNRHEIFTDLHWVIQGLIYSILIIMIIIFKFEVYSPFIYAGF